MSGCIQAATMFSLTRARSGLTTAWAFLSVINQMRLSKRRDFQEMSSPLDKMIGRGREIPSSSYPRFCNLYRSPGNVRLSCAVARSTISTASSTVKFSTACLSHAFRVGRLCTPACLGFHGRNLGKRNAAWSRHAANSSWNSALARRATAAVRFVSPRARACTLHLL